MRRFVAGLLFVGGLLCGALAQPHLVWAGAASAVGFRLDTFGTHAAVLSVEAPHEQLATALSVDGMTFKIHLPEGVFLDRSPFPPEAGSSITALNQLRGETGADLVVSVQPGTMVTGRAGPHGVRYIFSAAAERDERVVESANAELECAAAHSKVAELQGLVRLLTLEVLSLKQEHSLAPSSAESNMRDLHESTGEE